MGGQLLSSQILVAVSWCYHMKYLNEGKSQRGIKCQLYCLKYNLVKVIVFGSCVHEYYLDSSDKLKDFDPAFV